tara:strand:+ start:2146 stop:3021 length:876 start_codon:yes stop_codon:yes gene_type:complete
MIVSTRILISQDTFSIVAVDTITGQVGSAGASCIQGSIIISDIHPGVGAIHTQSYWNAINQDSASSLMDQGYTPQDIIDWLVANDSQNDPTIRQYGIVDLIDGGRSAGYTGENCYDFKGHKLGENYAIQGNILLGQSILDDMETAFLTQYGTFEEKLMASLMAANVTGADTRCTPYGTPAISAFIRVSESDNSEDSLFMDINVNNAPLTLNPLDSLRLLYWDWKIAHYILGDINFDRHVNIIDILSLCDHIGDFQLIMEHAFEASDMNMNGGLEITDLYLLVYQIIGIIEN